MENKKAHSYTDTTAHALENKGSLDALKNTSHQEPFWLYRTLEFAIFFSLKIINVLILYHYWARLKPFWSLKSTQMELVL